MDEMKKQLRAQYGENKKITDGNYDKSLAVKCINGTFVGKRIDNILVYKGIPFVGKQPVGDLRWKAPVDCLANDGVYEAYYNAKSAYGNEELEDGSLYYQGEDCLYLNVWKVDDEFTGKELISVYDEYMKTKDARLQNFLILHNFEDLKGMLTVINLLAYNNVFQGKYNYKNIEFDKDNLEIIFHLELNSPIIKRISYAIDNIYMTAYDNKLKILIKLYKGTLKFFYNDYKDYYYLPQEDVAIHKSLASFVNKEFRQKAKASNCYTKKDGYFIPQYHIIKTPCFYENYKDKISYFEVNEDLLNDKTLIIKYVSHILNYLKDLR